MNVELPELKIYWEACSMNEPMKLFSLLLSYPEAPLQHLLAELSTGYNVSGINPAQRHELHDFTSHYGQKELLDWQAEYVQLFDNTRTASLYLFEHLKGDSRERGQAMVDLIEFYKEHGFRLETNELPDYIPVFLEFLSQTDAAQALELLITVRKIFDKVFAVLDERQNPYRHILKAILLSLPDSAGDEQAGEPLPERKEVDFDSEYDEEPVSFGFDTPCKI